MEVEDEIVQSEGFRLDRYEALALLDFLFVSVNLTKPWHPEPQLEAENDIYDLTTFFLPDVVVPALTGLDGKGEWDTILFPATLSRI